MESLYFFFGFMVAMGALAFVVTLIIVYCYLKDKEDKL